MLQRGEDQMPAPGAQHGAVTVGHVQQPPHALQVFGRQHDGTGGGGRGRGLVRRGKGIPDGDDLPRSGITVAQQHGLFRGRGHLHVRPRVPRQLPRLHQKRPRQLPGEEN